LAWIKNKDFLAKVPMPDFRILLQAPLFPSFLRRQESRKVHAEGNRDKQLKKQEASRHFVKSSYVYILASKKNGTLYVGSQPTL
jgi:hypothetical protein